MTPFATIELGGKPEGKGRGRVFVHNKTGRVTVATPANTRTYEAQLRYAATVAMCGRRPTELPVAVTMTVRFPFLSSWSKRDLAAAQSETMRPTKKPDADNTLKLCDALNGIVWKDDAQVVEAHVTKVYSERPGLCIVVETIEPPALPDAAAPRRGIVNGDLLAGSAT